MSEFQKNIIEKLLKEKRKSKRDLSKFLNIKENSVNRTIKNPNITIRKLEKISEFLEIDFNELLQKLKPSQGDISQYLKKKDVACDNQSIIANLSETLRIQVRTIEMMMETEKNNSKNIENLVRLVTEKFQGDRVDI
ncbi:MAG: helix-turn-helix transcriptional regulator [Dysgonamonadaceae bacterium]|jgi:DNA-binding Xre family transcriptional regulator|nr:helix-turn-helix transcriptional regulator [Dysgonamonadaceae bacterium]